MVSLNPAFGAHFQIATKEAVPGYSGPRAGRESVINPMGAGTARSLPARTRDYRTGTAIPATSHERGAVPPATTGTRCVDATLPREQCWHRSSQQWPSPAAPMLQAEPNRQKPHRQLPITPEALFRPRTSSECPDTHDPGQRTTSQCPLRARLYPPRTPNPWSVSFSRELARRPAFE